MARAPAPAGLRCRSWTGADRLFHTDPRWLGGDDAYSVALDAARSVWLFGDSFVSSGADGDRGRATVVRNSVAIQHGRDPATARMEHHWRTRDDGTPASFFAGANDRWLWPGHGARVGRSLLLFFMEVRPGRRPATGPFDFEVGGWRAGLVENPDGPPPEWRMRWLPVPREDGRRWTVGSAGVVVAGEHVYAPAGDPCHDAFLLRWPVGEAEAGDLRRPEHWCGPAAGWRHAAADRARPVLRDAQTEFTIHHDPRRRRFVQVQSRGLWQSDLAVRFATAVEGPWSPLTAVFRPPEADRGDAWVYAVKAHPQLTGAARGDLVLTYACNGRWPAVERDLSLYFPRFVLARPA